MPNKIMWNTRWFINLTFVYSLSTLSPEMSTHVGGIGGIVFIHFIINDSKPFRKPSRQRKKKREIVARLF